MCLPIPKSSALNNHCLQSDFHRNGSFIQLLNLLLVCLYMEFCVVFIRPEELIAKLAVDYISIFSILIFPGWGRGWAAISLVLMLFIDELYGNPCFRNAHFELCPGDTDALLLWKTLTFENLVPWEQSYGSHKTGE